jgi:hypothetical protein
MLQIVSVRKRVGGLKLEDLPGLDALQIPGVASNRPSKNIYLNYLGNSIF